MKGQHAGIVAVITMNPESVQSGGAPVFFVKDNKDLQKIGMTLEKIMDAAAHEIDASTLVIVAH